MQVKTFVTSRGEYVRRLKAMVREDTRAWGDDLEESFEEDLKALRGARKVSDVIRVMRDLSWDVETVMVVLVEAIGPFWKNDLVDLPPAWSFDT